MIHVSKLSHGNLTITPFGVELKGKTLPNSIREIVVVVFVLNTDKHLRCAGGFSFTNNLVASLPMETLQELPTVKGLSRVKHKRL